MNLAAFFQSSDVVFIPRMFFGGCSLSKNTGIRPEAHATYRCIDDHIHNGIILFLNDSISQEFMFLMCWNSISIDREAI